MPTQRFEAATLEAAVARARAALGREVAVVSAERVRSGGIAGWFARERVEVTVVVDGPPGDGGAGAGEPAPVRPRRGHRPAGPDGRAVPSPLAGGAAASSSDGPPAAGRRPAPTTAEETLNELLEQALAAPPSSIIEMAASIDDADGVDLSDAAVGAHPPEAGADPASAPPTGRDRRRWSPKPRRVDTPTAASAGFAAVLEDIVRQAGVEQTGTTDPGHPGPVDALVAGGPAAACRPGALDGRVAAGPAGASRARRATAEPAADGAAVIPSRRVLRGTAELAILDGDPAPPAPPPPSPAASRQVTASPGRTDAPIDRADAPIGRADAIARADAIGRADASMRRAPAPNGPVCGGLPAHYLADAVPGITPAATLRRALRRLPLAPPLPAEAGTVVVVVGERRHAAPVAAALCASLGIGEAAMVLAAPRRGGASSSPVLTRAALAAEERRSWRWRSGPTVVLVDARLDPGGGPWAPAMLRALEPTLCWGVVEAARKPEDVASWSERLGRLDAIALVDASATCTPASVLELDIPVVAIDGRPADADAWYDLLEPGLAGAFG